MKKIDTTHKFLNDDDRCNFCDYKDKPECGDAECYEAVFPEYCYDATSDGYFEYYYIFTSNKSIVEEISNMPNV